MGTKTKTNSIVLFSIMSDSVIPILASLEIFLATSLIAHGGSNTQFSKNVVVELTERCMLHVNAVTSNRIDTWLLLIFRIFNPHRRSVTARRPKSKLL